MLSIETEARVAIILLALAEGERKVENSRQIITKKEEFNAFKIFRILDNEGKNKINAMNINDFLRKKGIFCSKEEIELLICFYDQNGDKNISYCEFLKLIKPEDSIKRNNLYDNSENISKNIEYSLVNLLEEEVALMRNFLSLLKNLKLRDDFNVQNIYNALKNLNTITAESLIAFLERNHAIFQSYDIKNIIKRLDLNDDGRVDFSDFNTLFGFNSNTNISQSSSYINNSTLNHFSNLERNEQSKETKHREIFISQEGLDKVNIFDTDNFPTKPLEYLDDYYRTFSMTSTFQNKNTSSNLSLRLSPERKYPPAKESFTSFSPQFKEKCKGFSFRESRNYLVALNPNDNSKKNARNNNYNNSINSKINERKRNKFMNFLKYLMEVEIDIEGIKIALSLRGDFKAEDCFILFDSQRKGYLSLDDIKKGLNSLGIFPTIPEIKLLMNRFDLQKQGVLSFADFFDMVVPFDKNYRTMVETRPSNAKWYTQYSNTFQKTTCEYLKNLFIEVINYESKINKMRVELKEILSCLQELFREIDLFGNGYFDDRELNVYLKKQNEFTSSQASDLLFIRLDKKRNGRVDFSEVEEEFKECI